MGILPIGFFMPLPLAMMIPFMGIQSAVMMKQAGENWQYGKRRISAMSNDEFNVLTPQKLNQNNNEEIRSMIPDMKQAIIDMRDFQDFILVEVIELIRRGLETGLGAIFGLSPTQSNEFFGGTPPPTHDLTPVPDTVVHDQGSPTHTTGAIGTADYKYHQEQFRIKQEKLAREKKQRLVDQQSTNKEIDKIIIATPKPTRKAGQSQRNERNMLIKKINDAHINIKTQQARIDSNPNAGPANLQRLNQIKLNRDIIRKTQLLLAQLLQRYQF